MTTTKEVSVELKCCRIVLACLPQQHDFRPAQLLNVLSHVIRRHSRRIAVLHEHVVRSEKVEGKDYNLRHRRTK